MLEREEMTREFKSLADFALHLVERRVAVAVALHEGLERAAVKVEKTAKSEFGVYQPGVEHFPAWPELADATKDDRVRQGFSEDEPLLRTGELRDTIGHETHGLQATVGSTSDVMVFHEFGTAKMPPRPVLGPAVYRDKDAIEEILGAAAVTGLVGGSAIHPSLGYDFETSK